MELGGRWLVERLTTNKMLNINSGYGALQLTNFPLTSGKVFMVAASTDANYNVLTQLFKPDSEGVVRLYSTITLALAACVAAKGDIILLSKGFTTAPTLAELETANTKGVIMEQAGGRLGDAFYTGRVAATLPATTKTAYFTVTGKIKLLDIVGEVTTVVQAQANAIKLVATPTVGAAVDLCATVDSNAAAVGSIFTITGTLADAMVKTVSGAGVAQAAPLIIAAGTIGLNTAATNTGATKWLVRYQPLETGARVFAA